MIDLTPDKLKEVFEEPGMITVEKSFHDMLKEENKNLKKQIKLLIEALKIKNNI